VCLTKRALDEWDSVPFSAPEQDLALEVLSMPAYPQVAHILSPPSSLPKCREAPAMNSSKPKRIKLEEVLDPITDYD
jgi:hypothetical protein